MVFTGGRANLAQRAAIFRLNGDISQGIVDEARAARINQTLGYLLMASVRMAAYRRIRPYKPRWLVGPIK